MKTIAMIAALIAVSTAAQAEPRAGNCWAWVMKGDNLICDTEQADAIAREAQPATPARVISTKEIFHDPRSDPRPAPPPPVVQTYSYSRSYTRWSIPRAPHCTTYPSNGGRMYVTECY